jgi:hypothetical protein
MEDTLLRMPVVCPSCAKESLTELPTTSVAEALANGDPIRLYANCHREAWQASCLEREQLREYLEVANLSQSRVLKSRRPPPVDPYPR